MTDHGFGILATIRRALTGGSAEPSTDWRGAPPLALVYRGPASLPGCPEAVANLLAASRWGFDVRYVGPKEKLRLSAETLAGATLYAQPGGGTLGAAYRKLGRHRGEIRDFVRSGGRYLGFCLGGYLAGATPGFGLLPGDTDQYISSKKATVKSDGNALVHVAWRGQKKTLFFQDGPYFWLHSDATATVLATYSNNKIAAVVTEFGAGRVGVVGPHPEATEDWFVDAGLRDPGHGGSDPAAARGLDAGLDLVDAVMT